MSVYRFTATVDVEVDADDCEIPVDEAREWLERTLDSEGITTVAIMGGKKQPQEKGD